MNSAFILLFFIGEAEIHLYPFTLGAGLSLLLTLLLLIASGLLSGSETALFSLTPSEIKKLENQKNARSGATVKLLKTPDILLATILIGNNLINISIVILSTFVSNSLIDFSAAPLIGFLFQVVVITFLLLMVGEILPKIYATHYAMQLSLFMAYPLLILNRLFKPLSLFMVRSSRLFKRRIARPRSNLSIDDLSHALELTSGSMMEDKNILKGIVKFGNIDVRDVMRSRLDVVAADIRLPLGELVKLIVESGYSRIPIFSESLDNIKGILYIKDLLPHFHKNDSFRWQTLIRPQFYVPESKKISELLNEFQRHKIHMAIVIDEYGGTQGIITLEDILEEIIGEINDESDDADEKTWEKIDELHYLFEGKTLLNDLYKITGVESHSFDEVKGDADTLAGLLLEVKGEFPQAGETIRLGRFEFRIESIDGRRIKWIRFTQHPRA
ncbi:MAG: gliding motility-associated protein GldE [Bacteroidales bacterium]